MQRYNAVVQIDGSSAITKEHVLEGERVWF